MAKKIKATVNTNNVEVKNMENVNNTQAPVNAAPAAEQVTPEQNNVPTPPANEQAPASEEKPKKKGLIKKILMIIGAVIALITGGFIAGRVSGKKSSDEDYDDTEDDPQITEF